MALLRVSVRPTLPAKWIVKKLHFHRFMTYHFVTDRPMLRAMRRTGFADVFLWQLERGGATPLYRQIQRQLRDGHPVARAASGRAAAVDARAGRRDSASRAPASIAAYDELLRRGLSLGPRRLGHVRVVGSARADREGGARRPARRRCRAPLPAAARGRAPLAALATDALESEERPFQTGRSLVDARTLEAWRRLTQRALRELGIPAPRLHRSARPARAAPQPLRVPEGVARRALRARADPGDVGNAARARPRDPRPARAGRRGVGRGSRLPDDVRRAGGRRRAAAPRPGGRAGARRARGAARGAARARGLRHAVAPVPAGPRALDARAASSCWRARASAGAWIFEDDYDSEFRYAGRPLAVAAGSRRRRARALRRHVQQGALSRRCASATSWCRRRWCARSPSRGT